MAPNFGWEAFHTTLRQKQIISLASNRQFTYRFRLFWCINPEIALARLHIAHIHCKEHASIKIHKSKGRTSLWGHDKYWAQNEEREKRRKWLTLRKSKIQFRILNRQTEKTSRTKVEICAYTYGGVKIKFLGFWKLKPKITILKVEITIWRSNRDSGLQFSETEEILFWLHSYNKTEEEENIFLIFHFQASDIWHITYIKNNIEWIAREISLLLHRRLCPKL